MNEKNDKTDSEKKSLSNSGEIFDSVFKDAINGGNAEPAVEAKEPEKISFNNSAILYDNVIREHLIVDSSDVAWRTLDNRSKIIQLLNYLISDRKEIQIRLKGEKTSFTSRFINLEQDEFSSEIDIRDILTIEKLSPAAGNKLIHSFPEVVAEFLINKNLCRCSLKYVGISNNPPHFGFLLGFPESVEVKEKRREERIVFEVPTFISAEFSLGKKKKEKKYNLNVLNCSKHGLGMVITEKDVDLLRILNKGDTLEDISLFASWTVLKVNGTVSHITKIKEGEYQDSYLLGVDSPDIIESCKPPEQ